MTTLSAEDKARQDAARQKNGEFGPQLHGTPGFELTAAPDSADDIAVLEDFAADQPNTVEGRDRANQARIAIAARNIHASLPEVRSFTMERDGEEWTVDSAWDSRGWRMGAEDRKAIEREIAEAGAAYTGDMVVVEEARQWTPDRISPTSPKVTSKGRTVFVTLPDGVVVDRTSKSNHYTHAIIATPEDPELVAAEARRNIEESQKVVEDIDAALAAEKLSIRRKQRFRSDRDPDLNYQGKPSYTGFEYRIYSADGKRELDYVWGNSRQETQGAFDEEGKYDGKRIEKVFPAARAKLTDKRRIHQESIDREAKRLAAVNDGSYDVGGWSVYGFSGSADNANKTARGETNRARRTRRFSVTAVDK